MSDGRLTPTSKIYDDVVRGVVEGVRADFAEECVDQQVLLELENAWRSKLYKEKGSRAAVVREEAASTSGAYQLLTRDPSCTLRNFESKLPASFSASVVETPQSGREQLVVLKYIDQSDGNGDCSPSSSSASSEVTDTEAAKDEELNSEDDLTDENEDWETNNIVICQYDKVAKTKDRKYKLFLKRGILRLKDDEYAFGSLVGSAPWWERP